MRVENHILHNLIFSSNHLYGDRSSWSHSVGDQQGHAKLGTRLASHTQKWRFLDERSTCGWKEKTRKGKSKKELPMGQTLIKVHKFCSFVRLLVHETSIFKFTSWHNSVRFIWLTVKFLVVVACNPYLHHQSMESLRRFSYVFLFLSLMIWNATISDFV